MYRHFDRRARQNPFTIKITFFMAYFNKEIAKNSKKYHDEHYLNALMNEFFKKYWSYSDNLISFRKPKAWAFSGMFSHRIWTIFRDFMIFWKKSLFWMYGKVTIYRATQRSFLFFSVFFLDFLRYLSIAVLYDHDFDTVEKSYSWATF